MRPAACAQILGALAASLALAAHAGTACAGTVKARLTVQAKYELTSNEDVQENGETTQGSSKLSVTLSISRNVYLEYGGPGGADVRDIPPDEMTAADKPKTSGTLSFAADSTLSDRNGGSIHATQNFAGPLSAEETSASPGFDSGGMSVQLGAGGSFNGHCDEVIKSNGQPPQTSTDCGTNIAGQVDTAVLGTRAAGAGAAPDQGTLADIEASFNVSSKAQSPDAVPGLPPEAAAQMAFLDDGWYGAKTTGTAQSGFQLTLDKTRKFSPRKGLDETKRLQVTASLVPLGAECMLNEAMMRAAMARAMAGRHIATPPQYLTTAQHDPDFLTYAVRLGADDDLLPTQAWVRNAVAHGAKPQPGASYLMLGSAQLSDDTYRVTVRVVRTETGEVLVAARHDGKNCTSGLAIAATGALASLNAPLKSYRPR